ncbi:MAG: hypothetical protein IOC55_13150 [Methylobacterium sp.]|nr:hypothetical protein [Methylobacterium sp.]
MSGAGLARVPRHLFLHILKFLHSLKFPQSPDRARKFGRDMAIVKHATTACAPGKADRALSRRIKNAAPKTPRQERRAKNAVPRTPCQEHHAKNAAPRISFA